MFYLSLATTTVWGRINEDRPVVAHHLPVKSRTAKAENEDPAGIDGLRPGSAAAAPDGAPPVPGYGATGPDTPFG
ncbi:MULTISPECIES: hypothetical protein [Streptosporangium]|uniref:Uncharacterized protein n=1 Tax=Streptosporangium brasiliense TaxID=47480 RepID=A0ABT9QY47_9ACTN|nr:hypothetical protein [Streptosporangium brasiliense]MDP9861454.1 hypothetical protein [Streptosporangium brasiliense]